VSGLSIDTTKIESNPGWRASLGITWTLVHACLMRFSTQPTEIVALAESCSTLRGAGRASN